MTFKSQRWENGTSFLLSSSRSSFMMAPSKDEIARVQVRYESVFIHCCTVEWYLKCVSSSNPCRVREHPILAAEDNVPTQMSQPALSSIEKYTSPILAHSECLSNYKKSLAHNLKVKVLRCEKPNRDSIEWEDAIGLGALHLLCWFNGSSCFLEVLKLLRSNKRQMYKPSICEATRLFHYVCCNSLMSAAV